MEMSQKVILKESSQAVLLQLNSIQLIQYPHLPLNDPPTLSTSRYKLILILFDCRINWTVQARFIVILIDAHLGLGQLNDVSLQNGPPDL